MSTESTDAAYRHPDPSALFERIRGRLSTDHQLGLWADPEVRADLVDRVAHLAASEAAGTSRWNAADRAGQMSATFMPPPTEVDDDKAAVWRAGEFVVVGLPEGTDGASEPSVTIAGKRVPAQDALDLAETIRAAVVHARLSP